VTARPATPRGFKVVRVDMQNRQVVDFAVNTIADPASKLPYESFERPSHCQFGPDGTLYVVDWGQIEIAPEKGGIPMQKETGTLWRICRTAGSQGERPLHPVVLPLYGVQYPACVGGAIGPTVGGGWLLGRWLRTK